MATLLSKIRTITQSTVTETSETEVVNFAQAGANFVVMSMPKELLWFLGADLSNITNGDGQVVNPDTVLEVRRNGITCNEASVSLAYWLDYSGSLLEATAMSPRYYSRTGKIYIKPDPTESAVGIATVVRPPTITASTDVTALNYAVLENIIVLYAAALDFTALANYYSQKNITLVGSTGDARDALDKAKDLMDGTETTNNIQDWIDDEDSEMAVTTIQAAAQAVNRAIAEMQSGKEYSAEAQGYLTKAKQYFEMAMLELKGYIGSNSKMIQMTAQLQQAQGAR